MDGDNSITSFAVYLVSNSSMVLFPNNKPNSFTIKLPKEMNLQGEWETGISMIMYARQWQNIKSVTEFYAQFDIYDIQHGNPRDKLTIKIDVKVLPGNFKSYKEILKKIIYNTKEKIKTHVANMDKKKYRLHEQDIGDSFNLEFTYDEETEMIRLETDLKNFSFIMKEGNNEIWKALGWSQHNLNMCKVAPVRVKPELNMHLPALFIYANNLIQYQNIADTQGPLLAIVPLRGENGEYISERIQKPIYNRLVQNNIKQIEILVLDHLGKPIDFGKSIMLITLNFQRIK